MKKTIRLVFYFLVLGFIILQFFQPDKNLGDINLRDDLFQVATIDDSVKTLLENSCYDCHSNHTKYPWYSYISPVSLFLNNHIVEGKAELNFSDWGTYSKIDKISHLDDICDAVSEGEMPPGSYLILHKDASLSEKNIKKICDWAETEGMRLLKDEE